MGPDYRRPEVPTAGDWRWKAAEPGQPQPGERGWTVCNDPTLETLIAKASAANQDLRAAAARVDQARAAARISRADWFPPVNAAGDWARYRTSGNSPSPVPFPVPSFTQGRFTAGLDLSYELDVWGKVRRGFEAARHQAFAAEAARQTVLLTLQGDVAANYFTLRATRTEIDLLNRTIAVRGEALSIFEERFAKGLGSRFEVERARVEVAGAKASLAAAQQRQAELHNALALLCGETPAQFECDAHPGIADPPAVAPDLPSSLLQRRPDMAEAERQLAARNAQIGVAQASFFPVIRLTTSGGVLSGELTDLFAWESRVWSLSPGVSVPLFQGGRLRANLARARAAFEEAVAAYRHRVLVAFRDVEDSLAAIAFLKEQTGFRREATTAATAAAALALDRYRAGSVNFLEVVDAEQARLNAEIALLRTANDHWLATVRLIKSLGGGWQTAPF
jgi:multidrug efflux system outer membrane protein